MVSACEAVEIQRLGVVVTGDTVFGLDRLCDEDRGREWLEMILRDRLARLSLMPVAGGDHLLECAEHVMRACDELQAGYSLPFSSLREKVVPSTGVDRGDFDVGTVVSHLSWLASLRRETPHETRIMQSLEALFPGHRDASSFVPAVLDRFSREQWVAWSLVCGLVALGVLGRLVHDAVTQNAVLDLLKSWRDVVRREFGDEGSDPEGWGDPPAYVRKE